MYHVEGSPLRALVLAGRGCLQYKVREPSATVHWANNRLTINAHREGSATISQSVCTPSYLDNNQRANRTYWYVVTSGICH